ncbi:hypothetical protein H632_c1635p0 [Helicosporidium sp. ATCC 50920]|nr:hypothetical protein H632_c1635p0 [Helicosporidium sp. ATCC 50920]|eukprot:KDD74032.1 hypothetical protein H632_c1635p0 [Helicosporidium sp. ATCC 50920]
MRGEGGREEEEEAERRSGKGEGGASLAGERLGVPCSLAGSGAEVAGRTVSLRTGLSGSEMALVVSWRDRWAAC